MSSYPRAADRIAYNVRTGGLLAHSNLESDSLVYAAMSANVGPLRLREADKVHRFTHKAIARYVRTWKLPVLTELRERTWSMLNVGDPAGDRTVPVVFLSCKMVDEPFVSFLQSDILRQFGKWRIVHCEDSDRLDLTLAIYPDAISVGHKEPSRDVESHLAPWRRDIARFREPRDGPQRRQIEFVECAIGTKPPGFWKASVCKVIGAFDNYKGDCLSQAVWFILRGKDFYSVSIDGEGLSEGHYYPVTKAGRLGGDMALQSPTGLWIRQVLLPKAEVQRVRITRGGATSEILIRDFKADNDLANDTHRTF